MKKIVLLIIFLITSIPNFAQLINNGVLIKYIEVTGSAETEIIPDIITLSFEIKEYKDGKDEYPIALLDNKLKIIINQVDIPDSCLMVDNISGSQIQVRKKTTNFVSSKKYLLRLNDISKIDTLVNSISELNITKIKIANLTHSKLSNYRFDTKIRAIVAAKEKAEKLLNAIGEELGEAIYVEEDPSNTWNVGQGAWTNLKNTGSNSFNWTVSSKNETSIKKIKLKYEVKVRFRIK